MKNNREKREGGSGFFKLYLTQKAVKIILIIAVIVILFIGVSRYFLTESRTTKLGLIPFTQSKYIYSYDIQIKAGLDFEEIEWEVNGSTIEVRLPETKILSSEIDLDSFKVYLEDESIYREITLEENNEALKSMKQSAEDDAVANGLLENARSI